MTPAEQKRIESLSEDLQKIVTESKKDAPYAFIVTHGHRTNEEQDKMYAIGRTLPGKIITNAKGGESKHNKFPAEAFDVAIIIDKKAVWYPPALYIELADHILKTADDLFLKKEIKTILEWGGNWDKFKEFVHFYAEHIN